MAKRKTTPAQQRLTLVRARRLGAGNALAQILEELSPEAAHAAYEEWRVHPITMLMIDALRELSASPPPGYLDTESIPAQYGVSSALSLAAAFLADPRVLYPQLFSGAAPGQPRPDQLPTDYDVSYAESLGAG